MAAEKYPFFELKGIDWDEARERYSQAAQQAESDEEFYLVIQRMIAELRDGHSRFSFVGELWAPSVRSIELVAIDGRYHVARVLEGSDAWDAGVRAGAELLTVDGEAVSERFDRLKDRIGASNEQGLQRGFIALYLTAGESSHAQLELAAPGEEPQVYVIEREREPRRSEPVVDGWLLDSGYGYIRIRGFPKDDAAVDRFDALIDEFMAAKGLVIDIRGNGGGSTTPMYKMAGRLFEDKVEVFRWHKRRTKVRALKPRGKSVYVGPVVLLIDDAVFSTSNAFAEGLQFTGRATLVGRTSSGGTGIPELDELLTPDSRLRLSNYYHELVDGTQTEVTGVVPDVEIAWTAELLAAGAAQTPGDPAGDRDLVEAIAILDAQSYAGDTSAPGCGCSTAGPDEPGPWGSTTLIAVLGMSAWGVARRQSRRSATL